MRDLPIAYGNSCYAKTLANKTTAWEDLCERLKKHYPHDRNRGGISKAQKG